MQWENESLGHMQTAIKGPDKIVHLLRKLANNVDPDQMPQNAASDQGLHCL